MHTCNECGELASHYVPEDISDDITEPETYWCTMHAKSRIDARIIVHWNNPWEDAVPVPIEELAECHMGLGQSCGDVDGSSFILTKDRVLEHWCQYGEKLDAYILPCRSGWHSIGVRYGNEDPQYLSPAGDKEKVVALLRRYT